MKTMWSSSAVSFYLVSRRSSVWRARSGTTGMSKDANFQVSGTWEFTEYEGPARLFGGIEAFFKSPSPSSASFA